jgi:hypothetical protein
MSTRGFVVAMAAQIALAPYQRPMMTLRTLRKWLIVSRCGPSAEFLTISNTRGPPFADQAAPIGLTPAITAVGILSSEQAGESTFLLLRQRPSDLSIAGEFFPAEGYVRIHGASGTLGLQGGGRHAHSVGRADGVVFRTDVPNPAPSARDALAWRIDAVRRAWSGEFLP